MSPVANESGLKVLDEYFTRRRSEKVNAPAIGK